MKIKKPGKMVCEIIIMFGLTTIAFGFNGYGFGTGIMLGLLMAQIGLYIWARDKDRKGWTINIPDKIESQNRQVKE